MGAGFGARHEVRRSKSNSRGGASSGRDWMSLLAAARLDSLFQEKPLHRIAGERERGAEMRGGGRLVAAAQRHLAERGGIERIGAEALSPVDRGDRFEP